MTIKKKKDNSYISTIFKWKSPAMKKKMLAMFGDMFEDAWFENEYIQFTNIYSFTQMKKEKTQAEQDFIKNCKSLLKEPGEGVRYDDYDFIIKFTNGKTIILKASEWASICPYEEEIKNETA